MSIRESIILHFAKRYIAGRDITDLIAASKYLSKKGFKTVVNYLGEQVTMEDHVRNNVNEYTRLIEVLDQNKLTASISIKPTQIGLSLSYEKALKNIKTILEEAAHAKLFVWIDMESSQHTDHTLQLYYVLQQNFPNIGITLQSYLKRSQADLNRVLKYHGKVRLVKGAYKEPESVKLRSKEEIRNNLAGMIRTLFEQGIFFSIGTHDERLLNLATSISAESKNSNFEFQFLKGVREKRAVELLKSGFKASIYTPYGQNWLPYSVRRMKENKDTTFRFLNAILHI